MEGVDDYILFVYFAVMMYLIVFDNELGFWLRFSVNDSEETGILSVCVVYAAFRKDMYPNKINFILF